MQSRKIILSSLAGILLFLMAGFIWMFNQKSEQDARINQQIQSIPSMTLATLNGEKVQIDEFASDRPFLLVYFNSTCDMCKITLQALETRIEEFNHVRILLASNQLQNELEGVLEEYPFLLQQHVKLVLDEEMHLSTYLGVRSVPSIFCYDSSRALVASYQGPVKLDIILEKLPQRKEGRP